MHNFNIFIKFLKIIFTSFFCRSQTLNQADALEKLRAAIRFAVEPPKPKFTADEEEKIRKGKLKASRERLHTKRYKADVKSGRRE